MIENQEKIEYVVAYYSRQWQEQRSWKFPEDRLDEAKAMLKEKQDKGYKAKMYTERTSFVRIQWPHT